MASIFAKTPPASAPGQGVARSLKAGAYWIKSDPVDYNDTSPVTLFEVPDNTLVEEMIVEIITAFDGEIPSISVGVSGTTDRHVGTNQVDVKATGFTSVKKPHEYTADADIIATIVPSSAAAGQFRVWMKYRPLSDRQGL